MRPFPNYPRSRCARFQTLDQRNLLAAVEDESRDVVATPVVIDADWQLHFPGDRLDAEASARSFLTSISDRLGIRPDTTDLQQVEIKHGAASTHTRFQQVIDAIPVHGSTITVNQGPDGEIQNYFATTYPGLAIPATAVGGITFSTADQLARQAAGVEVEYLPSTGTLVWLPFSDDSARLTWRIDVYAARPVGNFLTLIDAQSGTVYSQENRAAFDSGSGNVFDPNPYQTQGSGSGLADNFDANSPSLTNELINVTLQGLDPGTGLLRGEYVDVTLPSPFLPENFANEPTRQYHYDRDDPRFEQVVVYHAIDQIQRYIQTLGFSSLNPISNGIRDVVPTRVNAHWDNEDQSFYMPGNDTLHFGDGGVDDGEDADIIAHEYGHAIQFDQNAFWGGGEMNAMGEGFSDYLAASFYEQFGDPAYQSSHAACVGEWDATSYDFNNPPCLRRVDGNKQYPDDLIPNDPHSNGEIWSAALWELRAEIGAQATDTLVLEHHFGLPSYASMPVAASAIVAADLNLNSGANEQAIRDAFCNRGILNGNDCQVVSPFGQIEGVNWNDLNGNGVRDMGEPGLPGWTIFIDENQNGVLDRPTTTFDSTHVPVAILGGQTVTSELTVSGIERPISDLNVTVDITHRYDDDVTLELESPDGERITLLSHVGGTEDNFTNTTLDDEASTPIANGSAPFTGSFIPQEPLSRFDGADPNGTWTLLISDSYILQNGILNAWSLTIETSETSTTTDFDGEYVLTVDTLDTYTIAEVQWAEWAQTFPGGGTHEVTVGPGQTAQGKDFGNQSTLAPATVVGRHLFYNHSAFDGNDPAANSQDDLAISDKVPLLAGGTATFENISNFSSGINGVIIDVTDLAQPQQLSPIDFEFRHGNDNDVQNWLSAPTPSITVDEGSGAGGADRVTLIWPDNTIENQWLEIRVRATPATGLTADDLFYFGNAVGETGNLPGDTTVDGADFQGIRQNRKNFLDPAAVDFVFDINRDKRVNATDLLLVRDFSSSMASLLELISP